jgi:trehalose 6-phosphate synthase/phosphatase
MKKGRWVIVSNRLPVSIDSKTRKIVQGSGGLVTALSNVKSKKETVWIGTLPGKTQEQILPRGLEVVNVEPDIYDRFYNGMSNDVLWPLFHYERQFVKFERRNWLAYIEVNRRFAEKILEIAKPDDLIWIHDFHLFMVPKFVKEKKRNLRIGFFLHIPFPSSEVFKELPVRKEILDGLIKADLIGFHDYSYLNHFCRSLSNTLGLDSSLLFVQTRNHRAQLGVFPVSIDAQKFQRKSNSPPVLKLAQDYAKRIPRSLVLGVDRLDYIKGIDLKLLAFAEALRRNPEFIGKLSLLQVAVPSREDVEEYQNLKQQVEQLVGKINGEFGKPGYIPVHYMFKSISFGELVALYRRSQALFISSKRDGMNLVSLEFIASQPEEDPGVVLLSEFTGAIGTLSNVLSINPWDIDRTAEKIIEAVTMPVRQRIALQKPMMEYLQNYSATAWAESFLNRLERSYIPDVHIIEEIKPSQKTNKGMKSLYKACKGAQVLVFLDYDGTLVPIQSHPDKAILTKDMKDVIRSLASDPSLEVIVVSGRDMNFLTKQLKGSRVSLAGEHGASYWNIRSREKISLVRSDVRSWYYMAKRIMSDYASRVPHSFVEEKEYALSWHYRNSPSDFAGYQSRKLAEELGVGLSKYPVTILQGKKVIEARAIEANKGSFVRWYAENQWQIYGDKKTIIALGDDATDEDMFTNLGENGISIRVGNGETKANYRLKKQEEVIELLKSIAKAAQED